MALYYVDSNKTGGTDTGENWTNAFLTLTQAMTAANADGDSIFVAHNHADPLTADTTFTFGANNVRILCRNSSTDALATGGVIGSQSGGFAVTFAGAYKSYVYGLTLKNGAGSTGKSITLGLTSGQHIEWENSRFELGGTAATNYVQWGNSTGNARCFVGLKDCAVKFNHASSAITITGKYSEVINLSIDPAGVTTTSNLFRVMSEMNAMFVGCDFSEHTGSLFGDLGSNGTAYALLRQCKLGSGSMKAAQTSAENRGGLTVVAYDCSSTDTNYAFYHSDPLGETVAYSSIYATNGAKTGGVGISYKVTTTAAATYLTPYVGPWIARPHTGTSAITPSIEAIRDGSATPYKDDEVWSEFEAKVTSGIPIVSHYSDRVAPLTAGSSQTTGALGAGDWTGETTTGAPDVAFMKLHLGSTITPAEVGHIYGRVVVGKASVSDLYYDPQIRVT